MHRNALLGLTGSAAAACSVLAVLLAGGLVAADSPPSPDRPDQMSERVDEALAPDERPVSAGLSLGNQGPLEVAVSEVSPSDNGWMQHAFVVRNSSADTVHLNDFRFSRFLGDRRLLLGLGCGHAVVDGVATEGCFADYRPRSLAPGESIEVPMLLFRDLPGMNPLHSGRFPAHANLSYRAGAPFTSPEDGAGARVAQVSLAYTVREPATGTDVPVPAPFSVPGVVPPGCVPGGVPQDALRCEIPGRLRVDVVEAELVGPLAGVATARPGSDTAIRYAAYVGVTLSAAEEVFAPGLAYGAASARAADGEGALGITGLCGRGWTDSGARVTQDPCPALTPVTGFGGGWDGAYGFTLHPRVGDREVQPGRYELVLPLETGDEDDALRLVLVVSPVAPA